MRMRTSLFWLAMAGLMVLPATARPAAEARGKGPTLVVQIQSIDDLLDDAKYLGSLSGKEERLEIYSRRMVYEGREYSFLEGWLRYKDDPDARVRARFAWEAKSLRDGYAAARRTSGR